MSKNLLILVSQKKDPTIDMAKIQIKSEKLTPFGAYFQSWSNLSLYIETSVNKGDNPAD